jgi:hypothetical protein
MTPAAMALVAQFESAAKTAQFAEAELRKRVAEQIGRLERQRAFAFRRTRLVRTLANSAGAQDSQPEQVWAAQRQAVSDELGWTGKSDAYDAILVQLQPVALAVWQCACAADGEAPPAVAPELETFEAWFEGAHGKSFYALFDQYVSEVPVVDF